MPGGSLPPQYARHLAQLAEEDPDRLKGIVSVHAEAIKAMAVWDEELFRLFIDYLSFETSEGLMTGAALKRAGRGRLGPQRPQVQTAKTHFHGPGAASHLHRATPATRS